MFTCSDPQRLRILEHIVATLKLMSAFRYSISLVPAHQPSRGARRRVARGGPKGDDDAFKCVFGAISLLRVR